MTHQVSYSLLVEQVGQVVVEMMEEFRPRLVDGALGGRPGERVNERHADNFLSKHDLWMQDAYRERLAPVLGSFVYSRPLTTAG